MLRDPATVRIPTTTDIHGRWEWHHRPSATTWRAEIVQPVAAGQISAIRRIGPARTIQRIKVVSPSGKDSELSIDEAIQMTESGRFTFFTRVPGFPEAGVIVDTTARGRRYLRTDADQTTGNNLAVLPIF
ncbi:DUF3892 domain-containing protein [Nonomuraea spiralis]|uniref:DUF3892 domain-containing protein n=1 Tax=Nonomuraea spiralis TaxID=46182 RepID=A0ABV5IZW8_9ACTN|nr:DUF3892 domain-containing protein [Nonomuraea spiralis]GGT16559.1 hypothetical protein GCM10010176_071340 [Nonomuraea spiralis]